MDQFIFIDINRFWGISSSIGFSFFAIFISSHFSTSISLLSVFPEPQKSVYFYVIINKNEDIEVIRRENEKIEVDLVVYIRKEREKLFEIVPREFSYHF